MIRFLIVFLCFNNMTIHGYETDQYTSIGESIKDSQSVYNNLVNSVIELIAKEWKGKKDNILFANKVAYYFNNRQLERWSNKTNQVDSFNSKNQSIYRFLSGIESPIIRYKVLASTINLNSTHLGTDKLSHFFGVGSLLFNNYTLALKKQKKQFSSSINEQALSRALRFSIKTELTYWGISTTGVYSNADIVVNYEGMKFFLSIFLDNIIKDKKSLIVWDGNKPRVNNLFSISDFVNDYWNEAYNPNKYRFGVYNKVKMALRDLCSKKDLENIQLKPRNEENLIENYEHLLSLSKGRELLRLDNICNELSNLSDKKYKKFKTDLKKMKKKVQSVKKLSPKDEPEIKEVLKQTFFLCRFEKKRARNEHEILLNFDKTKQEEIYLDLESQIISSGDKKICTEKKIPLSDSSLSVRSGKVKLSIEYCLELSNNDVEYQKKSKTYKYKTKKGTLYSFPGYIEFEDTKEYMFRTTYKNCNWY